MTDASSAKVQEISSKLHRTSDGLDPVMRALNDREEKRAQKRQVTSVTVLNAIANLVLSIAVLLAVWFLAHIAPVYFAADHGRIIRIYALSEPYRTPSDVVDFARQSLDRTFALDFSNYQMQLEDVRPRYTQDGFKELIQGLKENGILDMIKTKRMNLTSSTGTAVLIANGPDENGIYSWDVRVPLTLKLVGQTTEMPDQKLIATVRVRRIPTLDSVEGIAVAQVVTRPM